MAWEELASVYEQLHQCAFQIEDIAKVKERQRIARDLHDSLGHALTALNIQLQTALKLWKLDPAKAECFLLQAQRLGTTAMKEVRQSVCSLRATAKVDQPLEPLIESLVEDFRQVSDVSILTCINLSAVLPCEANTTLYRVVQESLTNIRKHAAATAVEIKINAIPHGVQLVVTDNGKGFKTDTSSKGFGLQGMAERVAALGGRFDIYTEPEKGCQICVELPLQQQASVQKSLNFAANVSPLKSAESTKHLVFSGKQSLQNIETKPNKCSQIGVDLPLQQQISIQNSLDYAADDTNITVLKSVKRLVLSSDRSVQLEEILTEYIGPIAPILLQKATEQIPSCQELVTKLLFYVPNRQRIEFEQRLSFLFDSSSSPEETNQGDWGKQQRSQVKESSPSSLPNTLYPNFSKNSKLPRSQLDIEADRELDGEIGIEQPLQQQALVQEPLDFAANVSTLEVAKPIERLVLSSEQLLRLEKILAEYIGITIAPMLLQEVIEQALSCQELVAELLLYACASQRTEFEQQLSFLFDSSPSLEETTQERFSDFSSQTVDESFIRQCEETLIDLIGPFAPLLIKETLKSSPGISHSELVEAIATKIPDARLVVKFRQALSDRPDTDETNQELLSYIPAVSQTEFEKRVAFLFDPPSSEVKTIRKRIPNSSGHCIDESFLHQCEQQLTDLVGPFAPLLIEETLESLPGISRSELVETVAAKIPDAQVAAEFQQRMDF
ncbi:sensor histidine kinase [Scytonema sp. NUACC26]|uniref:sensor histidine kinase n=1 Tax=Scytonema sp. NUACC26 TaxID=3140176 RepID=UPI0034DB93E3